MDKSIATNVITLDQIFARYLLSVIFLSKIYFMALCIFQKACVRHYLAERGVLGIRSFGITPICVKTPNLSP